jgi:predicted membrane metal-binding protein
MKRLTSVGLALAFLAVAATRHYLWPHFPAEMQGMVSKGCGAAAILFLLGVCAWRSSRLLLLVIAYWAWEELQVVLCSGLYLVEPWEVQPGQGICSAKIGLDLGALGILIVAGLLYYITRVGSGKTWHEG